MRGEGACSPAPAARRVTRSVTQRPSWDPLGDYETEHPGTALLIIEVADTTLKKDRAKATVYASAGIGEYWIVNLVARTVEVLVAQRGRYDEVRTLRIGDVLQPAALPDVAIGRMGLGVGGRATSSTGMDLMCLVDKCVHFEGAPLTAKRA